MGGVQSGACLSLTVLQDKAAAAAGMPLNGKTLVEEPRSSRLTMLAEK